MPLREPTPGTLLTSELLGLLIEAHRDHVDTAEVLMDPRYTRHPAMARKRVRLAVAIEHALAVAGEVHVVAELRAHSAVAVRRATECAWPHPINDAA